MNSGRFLKVNDELDFHLFWKILKKNLLLIVMIFVVCLLFAFAFIRYSVPVYSTRSVIQVDDNNESTYVLKNENVVKEDNIFKKLDFIRSPAFLSRVFNKLPLKILYYRVGTILEEDLYGKCPFSAEVNVLDPNIYDVPIHIEFANDNYCKLHYNLQGQSFEKACKFGDSVCFPGVMVRIHVNSENLKDVFNSKFFITALNPEKLVFYFSKNLNINILNEFSKTISIEFRDKNPLRAADIVNGIAEEFKVYDIEKKQESANNVIKFIDQQLNILENSLSENEESVSQYKAGNKIKMDFSNIKPLGVIQNNYSLVEQKVQNIDIENDICNSMLKEINQKEKPDVFSLMTSLAGTEYQGELQKKLTDLNESLTRKDELSFSLTENSEKIKLLNSKIEFQKRLIKETIISIQSNLNTRKKSFIAILHDLYSKSQSLTDSSNLIGFKKLQRISSISEKFYEELLDARTKYLITKAGFTSESSILEKAQPSINPIFPVKSTIYLTALFIALLLSITYVIVKYLFYNDIISLTDISKYIDVPILGVVPKYKKEIPKSQLVVDKRPKSVVAESLRSIRTNLQFISNEPGSKVIAITSTVSGEGKTFLAINLAGVIAFSEKKVILLDLDMRIPKIHLGFEVENTKGMSTLLTGKNSIDECIFESFSPNLHFITAGPTPPNPSELIIGGKLEEVVIKLKEKYDYIIIDNPPIGIVTDAMKSLQIADYPLYIFKSNFSKRFYIQNTEILIKGSNIRRLSVILNAVDQTGTGYYAKGYKGYGSSYGYGYAYASGNGYYDDDSDTVKSKSRLNTYFKRKK